MRMLINRRFAEVRSATSGSRAAMRESKSSSCVLVTSTSVIVICGLLGLLWLSTIPLTSSLVATFFGTQWMSMLFGIVFLSHQVGSFLGVWLAGRIFDMNKSYDAMWWISIALGLVAALIHWPIQEKPVARLAATSARTAGA